MGCLWSCEGGDEEQCKHCSRRAVTNLVVTNNECEICLDKAKQRNAQRRRTKVDTKSLFGEFRCGGCRHQWVSRQAWHDYQKCRRCGKQVYPYKLRPLRPSDIRKDKANLKEHPQELCGRCIKLGYSCGQIRK